MTTSQARTDVAIAPDDATVEGYLRQHPDFFVRHEALLAHLTLPHARGAATVSLVERQVEVLRAKNQALEDKLTELIAVARSNEQLVDKIHHFTRRVVAARDKQGVTVEVEKSLREDFGVFHAVLVLFGGAAAGVDSNRFVTILQAGDSRLAGFESLFESGKPRCGQVRDSHRDFLFGVDGGGLASLALLPLGGTTPFGLLALGSPDRDRFNPGMNTEFLARMGEIITDALAR